MNISSKLIFKPAQIHEARKKVEIALPEIGLPKQTSEESSVGEFPLPEEIQNLQQEEKNKLVEDINQELEEYRKKHLEQIKLDLDEAKMDAEAAKQEGKSLSFRAAQEAKEKAKMEIEAARNEVTQMKEQAKVDAERIVKEAEMRVNEIENEARQKGHEDGQESGFKEGEAESKRLVNRLGAIVGRAVDVREQLISDSEKQMVDLVLMIARKIIKNETAVRKEVVLNNIREVLKGTKDRDRIDIRVNFADLELTASHKDKIIQMMESLPKVNVYEDPRVDHGGCIIETEIGSIDARISTQFKQIEDAIRNVE